MTMLLLVVGLACLASVPAGSAAPARHGSQQSCPVFYTEVPTNCLPVSDKFLGPFSPASPLAEADVETLEDAVEALMVLQDQDFDSDYGTWPSSIDWTAAVTGTVISGMLTTLSESLATTDLGGLSNWKAKENLISTFYAQVVGSYFGQDVLSIRGQAYDDILWVALGWIESIKFVRTHSRLHYPPQGGVAGGRLQEKLGSVPWHGHTWFASFAHRARIFWNLGRHGWGTRLCNGGMVWNPRLNPYKNAITNELWIAASISMYEHFPGDNLTAPWVANTAFPTKDPAHLDAAVEGYDWLMNINMTNQKGLFVDGYHIDGRKAGNTHCDVRDEMVYTYNQGVLLTGQRGLWAVSGSPLYLGDGHALIQSVINATGWDLSDNTPTDDLSKIHFDLLPPWHGLGRGGIIEEQCDASGTCSQDGQAFKGIFFHHLATFCTPLDPILVEKGRTVDLRAFSRVQTAHAAACKSYLPWIKHNAVAALKTRDELGRFGMWWGAGISDAVVTLDNDGINHNAENTTDYRNSGTPEDNTWGEHHRWVPGTSGWNLMQRNTLLGTAGDQQVMEGPKDPGRTRGNPVSQGADRGEDPNERGRGRTVETQVGGLALLRAYWEISQSS